MDDLSNKLVERSLGYHGLPLQKIWEGERGENNLSTMGIRKPDFSTYLRRQKYLSFHDRAKRLKLHQFIAKKATQLFDPSVEKTLVQSSDKELKTITAELPPYELFCYPLDVNKRVEYFFHTIRPGDVVYGMVTAKTTQGLSIKVYYSIGSSSKYVADLTIRAFIPVLYLVPGIDKRNVAKGYNTNDLVCCEVIEIVPDTGKLICGMQGVTIFPEDSKVTLGLIGPENFPEIFKLFESKRTDSFEQFLEASPGFTNPNIEECLYKELGLDFDHHYTNMSSLRGRFPQQEYSNELRQVQATKWAFRSVAEGIEHFKEGRHSEAFQCLNKALSIDSRNVEGLVARGALYANSGSFKKAVDDFETALRLNPSHANARKYMGETLVALGRSYEDENKIDEARKAYQDCLNIIPHHEEAQHSLEFLKTKTNSKQIVEPGELELPALPMVKSPNDKLERETSLSKKDNESRKEKKNKKEKRKKNRKRKSSSSDSSSDSSDSSDSSSVSTSSSTDDSTTDSDSNSRHKKKRRSRSEKMRQKSLSPLSKRMSLGEPSGSGDQHYQSFHNMEPPVDDYESKVRKFLEMPRDEENYEEKVRRFVAEASKYQKERKIIEEKIKKKKRREERKAKKDSKKKRKREERKKTKGKKDRTDNDETKTIREALKIFENLPVLDELGSKLSEYYSKVDKNEEDDPNNKNVKSVNDKLVSLYDKEDDAAISKWKMKFSKDDRSKDVPGNSKTIPKQYAFGNESEESDDQQGYNIAGQQYPPPAPSMASTNTYDKNKRRPASPPSPPPAPASSSKSKDHVQPSQIKSGPVVLDKFGNFRLASMDSQKPPEPPIGRDRSNSKSRRKYGSSSSRSKSRSPRRRSRSGSYAGRKYSRSRSHSYNRRSGSRSRSRSYSRSHSRSRSLDRNRRYDRRTYRGRGGNYNDRGTYYKPRFNNSRGRGRGGNNGGPSNYRDYREYRGRGRPYRPRPRGGNGGPRYNRYRDDSRERRRDSRSRSFSEERPRSPNEEPRDWSDNERPRNSDDRKEKVAKDSDKQEDSRWTESGTAPVGTDHSLEEIEKFLEKTRKEKKEDMIERNKDMVKKNNW